MSKGDHQNKVLPRLLLDCTALLLLLLLLLVKSFIQNQTKRVLLVSEPSQYGNE